MNMDKEAPKDKIYESIKGLTEALGQAGLYKEEVVVTPDEIKELKSTIKIHSFILVSFFVAAVLALVGFVIDAVYFHITNSRYFENVYELKNNQQQQIDDTDKQFSEFQKNHPELFK